ncbi:fibronectin type III domain-containing protein [Arthrobacter sp. Leaf137]|uniref:rhamnogalacturonan lyase family protein n=1 Tax=Arthrobacter sp. Leaf137 TaxID=1736271 RepID=UPI000701098E|nr:fibronectin type III domain-containing protein [Arthrobacter sp. Leaf137]KQQ83149.1 G-D-S-L family lipolytic protein [Arthrobacter sp. Leaf137]
MRQTQQAVPLQPEGPPPRRRTLRSTGAKAVTAAAASAAIALAGLPPVHADTALPPVGSGFKFDFGPGATADGYTRVEAGTQYSATGKFGFSDTSVTSGTDRGTEDALRSDFVQAQGSSFLVDLPNGDYTVKLIAGDAVEATNIAITAEKMAKVQLTDKPASQYLEMEFPISLVDGQLNLDFSGAAANINSLVIAARAPRAATTDPAVYLTGDSTVQTYDPGFVPQAGWGQMIDRYFDSAVTFRNHAIGGRSSKNFISQGRLDEVLRVINPGDYLMVQFGHNDATVGVDDRYASPADYKEYLRTYVHGARQRGAIPILVTPVGRRDYDEATGKFRVSFPEYVAKMQELAAEENVAVVDLSASSRAYYDAIGPEDTKSVFLHVDAGVYPNRPTGTVDNTHFQEYGAIQIARLVAGGVKQLNVPLASRVKEVAPPSSVPSKPQGLVAGSVSNAGALLKWQPVDGADIYKVYRKLASEPDSAFQLTTTATVPTANLAGLTEGTKYSVRIAAMNGKGLSEPSDTLAVSTKQAKYKFDFGPVGAPVEPGYTEVNRTMVYSPERTFGFKDLSVLSDRDRGAVTSNLLRDFVLSGTSFEFQLDVPNGTYALKTYHSDWIGSTRTDVAAEGIPFGQVSSSRASSATKIINQVLVSDGQLNLTISGSGQRLNGLEVTPLLVGPTNLRTTAVDAAVEPATVDLAWDAVGDAAGYKVFRQASFETEPHLVAENVAVPAFHDTTALAGLKYKYFVTALDNTGLESVPSNTVETALVDPNTPVPAATGKVDVKAVDKTSVTLKWQKVSNAAFYQVYRSTSPDGPFEYVGRASEVTYTDYTVLTTIKYYYRVTTVNKGGESAPSPVAGTEKITVVNRQMEKLDRAPVALLVDGGVRVGWRMLGLDPEQIGFHVIRDGVKLTKEPIRNSTTFLDPAGTVSSRYVIKAVGAGGDQLTQEFTPLAQSYLSVKLDKPADDYTKDGQPYTYSAGDSSVADLDGDGTYEILQMWSPSNAKDNSQSGYTGTVYVDAYRMDGTRLWRINMGPNIRAGAHYTQLLAYDFDGDGKAEVAMKTADGTRDAAGTVIGNAGADYRNSSGYVLSGPEFLTVFHGATGTIMDTVAYDPPRGDVGAWGDTYGNRVDRFLGAVAYLDGERPSMMFSRGYYTRAALAAYDLVNGKITKRWTFDSDIAGAQYRGQGNHNLSVADVDADGKDEFIFGSMTIDDNGKPLYTTGLGHGDAIHTSDFDPSRPGLETFAAHEDMGSSGNLGATFRDSKTGQILWSIPAVKDTGRAAMGDIDPRYAGAEGWAIGGDAAWNSPVGQLRSAKGELIAEQIPAANFLAWWDGDLLREVVDHDWNATTNTGTPSIAKWNWETESSDRLLTATGAKSNNSTKGTPAIQADLLGDWREEIAWPSADSTELRIYTTSSGTDLRLRTLMHDPVYRLSVARENISYNQPPHPGFFIGEGMELPTQPDIVYTRAG